jgi:hypothetical protein
MANEQCFPDWLIRDSVQRYGPGYTNIIPYPVFIAQNPIYSANNGNSNSVFKNNAYYQSAAGQIAVANVATSIVEIVPNNVYDTIDIIAFVSPGAPPALGVPIFFSMDKPGRATNGAAIKTPIQSSVEAFLYTGTAAFDPADPSGYPTCIQLPQVMLNLGLTAPAAIYTNFLYSTVLTDRPFYLWFNDGIATAPAGGTTINFKTSWYVTGR